MELIIGVDHIGIAVNALEDAISLYRDVIGLKLEGVHTVEEQKVKVAFFSAGGDTRIELLEPTGSESPVARFLESRGEGVHHISLKVTDIDVVLKKLKEKGLRLVNEEPRIGADGTKIAFIHPKSTRNVLFELCEEP